MQYSVGNCVSDVYISKFPTISDRLVEYSLLSESWIIFGLKIGSQRITNFIRKCQILLRMICLMFWNGFESRCLNIITVDSGKERNLSPNLACHGKDATEESNEWHIYKYFNIFLDEKKKCLGKLDFCIKHVGYWF